MYQFHVESFDGVSYFELPYYLISKLEEDDQNELEPIFKGYIKLNKSRQMLTHDKVILLQPETFQSRLDGTIK